MPTDQEWFNAGFNGELDDFFTQRQADEFPQGKIPEGEAIVNPDVELVEF